MIVLHSNVCPELICEDASLASQSQKASTLITEILKRFTATGVLPNAHHPSEALDPQAFPESFVDGANAYTERKENYDNENLSFTEGLKRDFDGFVASSVVSESGTTSEGESRTGETPDGSNGNSVSEGVE